MDDAEWWERAHGHDCEALALQLRRRVKQLFTLRSLLTKMLPLLETSGDEAAKARARMCAKELCEEGIALCNAHGISKCEDSSSTTKS